MRAIIFVLAFVALASLVVFGLKGPRFGEKLVHSDPGASSKVSPAQHGLVDPKPAPAAETSLKILPGSDGRKAGPGEASPALKTANALPSAN